MHKAPGSVVIDRAMPGAPGSVSTHSPQPTEATEETAAALLNLVEDSTNQESPAKRLRHAVQQQQIANPTQILDQKDNKIAKQQQQITDLKQLIGAMNLQFAQNYEKQQQQITDLKQLIGAMKLQFQQNDEQQQQQIANLTQKLDQQQQQIATLIQLSGQHEALLISMQTKDYPDNDPLLRKHYKGAMNRGIPHGPGTMTFKDGSTQVGMFAQGLLTSGTTFFSDRQGLKKTHLYAGEMKRDSPESKKLRFFPNGKGVLFFSNGARLQVQWEDCKLTKGSQVIGVDQTTLTCLQPLAIPDSDYDGTLSGQFINEQGKTVVNPTFDIGNSTLDTSLTRAKITYPKDDYKFRESYEGYLKDGEPHGQGIMRFTDKAFIVGIFEENECVGKFSFTDGHSCIGRFKNFKIDGKAILLCPNGAYIEANFTEGGVHPVGIKLISPDQKTLTCKSSPPILKLLPEWLKEGSLKGTFINEKGETVQDPFFATGLSSQS